MHPLSESGFSFDKLSPVSFQPSPYLRLLESHTQNEPHHSDHRIEIQSSHGHTEIQSNYKTTSVHRTLQLTGIPSSYQVSESRPRSPHTPFKVLQPADPSDSLPSFTPVLGGMLQCLQKLEEEVSQVNGVMHQSKPITFLTTYYCYSHGFTSFLSCDAFCLFCLWILRREKCRLKLLDISTKRALKIELSNWAAFSLENHLNLRWKAELMVGLRQ